MREVKFLTKDDIDQYTDLYNSSQFFSHTEKTEEESKTFLQNACNDLLDENSNKKYSGVIEDGQLIFSVSGAFYPDLSYWYLFKNISRTTQGLGAGLHFKNNFTDTVNLLMAHGEKLGCFGIYGKRPYRDEVIVENKFIKTHMQRYVLFHEAVYPAGTTVDSVTNRLHKPLFTKDPLPVNFMVTLAMLNQENRMNILHEKYKEYSYNKTDFK